MLEHLLEELCALSGPSGREEAVREYIIAKLGEIPYTVDALGNLTVRVKGKRRAKHTVALFAHMDEVGVMATFVRADGLVHFTTVGGIQGTALAGKAVAFENGAYGVIGLKPLHLCGGEERGKAPEPADLLIDVGASSRETCPVAPGDTAVFLPGVASLGEHKLLSKAIDDRAGCAVLLDMILAGPEYDTVFCFTVQEEVGLRGAKTAAFGARPEYAVVIEGTTAADVADAEENARVCVQGKGACVSLMDRATVYSPALVARVFEIARENGIPAQPKTAVAGGNDAGSVHVSGEGVKTVTLNVPTRYIHSPSSVCDLRDLHAVRALAEKVSAAFANGSAGV